MYKQATMIIEVSHCKQKARSICCRLPSGLIFYFAYSVEDVFKYIKIVLIESILDNHLVLANVDSVCHFKAS